MGAGVRADVRAEPPPEGGSTTSWSSSAVALTTSRRRGHVRSGTPHTPRDPMGPLTASAPCVGSPGLSRLFSRVPSTTLSPPLPPLSPLLAPLPLPSTASSRRRPLMCALSCPCPLVPCAAPASRPLALARAHAPRLRALHEQPWRVLCVPLSVSEGTGGGPTEDGSRQREGKGHNEGEAPTGVRDEYVHGAGAGGQADSP